MRTISFLLFIILLAGAAIFFTQQRWHLKNKHWATTPAINSQLRTLGDSALRNADAPVASLLLYNGNVIGAGYNTVRKNTKAGEHAEINAISNAMARVGLDSFIHLNRDSLLLITTWEPCLMCRGAITEYNIPHVVVMRTKSLHHWMREWKKILKYEWNKQTTQNDTLQENLFRQSPMYDARKMKDNY